MDCHGFPTSGSLNAQKERMAGILCLGQNRESQQHVLKAVSFSQALKGDSKVDVALDDVTKFMATYTTGGGEMICKKVETLKAANEWLLSLSVASMQGSLTSGLNKIKQGAKPSAEMEKEVDKLMEEKGSALALLGGKESSVVAPSDAADVTATFLSSATKTSVELPPSTVCIHKGSLNTFISMACANHTIYGVLLGKQAWNGRFHATNIVLCDDPSRSLPTLLEKGKLADHSKSMSVECCGMIVGGDWDYWHKDDNRLKALGSLSFPVPPLFILVHFGQKSTGEVASWEVNLEDGATRATSISYTSQPHDVKKRFLYNICWVHDLGVSHMEHAAKKICRGIVDHVMNIEAKTGRSPTKMKKPFRKVKVPADGMCGWYALLAAEDHVSWEKIPRNEGAYPINGVVQKQELNNAKNLHEAVCEKALNVCDQSYHKAIRDVLERPNFSPSDLEWIAYTCSVAIRCTCDPKAMCY